MNQWADERKSRVQFGYDADEAAEAWWCAVGEEKLSELARGGVDGGEVAGGERCLLCVFDEDGDVVDRHGSLGHAGGLVDVDYRRRR